MSEPQVLELARELRSSIELKMSAKGERYWDIKIYFEVGLEHDALDRIRFIDAALRAAYQPPAPELLP